MDSKIKVGYLFPGQGAQHIGMGKDLYENFKEAREVFDSANELLDFDVKKICFDGPSDKITQTRFAQPAIFVNSMASLAVLRARLEDSYIEAGAAGLSLGEATALVSAGVMNFKEGICFVRDRGLFMDEASQEEPGSMAAVMGLSLEVVEEICSQTGAEVGNLNSPGQIVISGRKAPVEAALVQSKERGASRCVPLGVSGAFHSSCMNSACRRIEQALDKITLKAPAFPVVSNLTANVEADPTRIKQNLVNQMNHRTLWEASMRHMIDMGIQHFYEVGPGKVLRGLMRRIDSKVKVQSLGAAEDFQMLRSLT